MLGQIVKTCDSLVPSHSSGPIRCADFKDTEVLQVYEGGEGEPCKQVASALNKMAGMARFGDHFDEDDSTVACTIEGYITAGLNDCKTTVKAMNDAEVVADVV